MILSEDTSVFDAGQRAAVAGLYLICNGRESKISPFVPPGWFRVAVKIKPATSSYRGSLPCAT